MARHLLKCAERVKHGLCATIEVCSRAHVFSPALLRASAWVLPPRRPGAAKALLGPRRAACGVRDDGFGGLRRAGDTAVVKRFSGVPFSGTGVHFRHPFFRVAFEDGDAEEYTGKQLAAVLRLRLGCFHLAGPRLPRRSWARNSMTADAPL
jgi:hypothetical protein